MRGALEPLWVSGLAVACLVGARGLPLTGEAAEWGAYLALGTVFPAGALGLAWASRAADTDPRLRRVRVTLGMAGLAAAALLWLRHLDGWVILLATGTWFGLRVPALCRPDQRRARAGLAGEAVALLILLASWTAASRIVWWMPFGRLLAGSWYAAALLAGTLAAAVLVGGDPARERGSRARGVATLAALGLLALTSLRTRSLDGGLIFHHWGVIVGPAELVRQGGWLLWDVPAQYGFLNTLAIAAAPARSVWQGFYALSAALGFVAAAILFLVLRGGRRGLPATGAALAVTVATVFLVPGWPNLSTGPWAVPNVGPWRFVWCYVLVGILFWRERAGARHDGAARAAGCAAWLLGTLWSAESAVYCAAIWLPAHALLILARPAGAEPRPACRRLAPLLVPPALLAAAAVTLLVWYGLRLGHGPDWYAFVEYALAFGSGVMALPVDPGGAVWMLVIAFCAVSTVAAGLVAGRAPQPALALGWAAWATLWVTASYFVSRSHETNATNLSPLVCLSLGAALHLLARYPLRPSWAAWPRLVVVPLVALLLAIGFGHRDGVRAWAGDLSHGYERRLDRRLPVVDPELSRLLTAVGVHPADPIVIAHLARDPLPAWDVVVDGRVRRLVSHRAWVPAAPFGLFLPLADARVRVYIERFTERACLAGWLVQPRAATAGLPPGVLAPFFAQVAQSHAAAAEGASPGWRVIRFEPRAAGCRGQATAPAG